MTKDKTQQIAKFIVFLFVILLLGFVVFFIISPFKNLPEFTTKNEKAEEFCKSQEMILVDLWNYLNKATCGFVDDTSIKEKRIIEYVEGISDWRFRN